MEMLAFTMISKACLMLSLVTVVLSGGGFGAPGFYGAAPSSAPQPYSFGYDITVGAGTQLFHKEQGDSSGSKTGSYGYRDASGLYRTVKYVADAKGFRATIDTNEPGTLPGASADAVFNAKPTAAPAGSHGSSAAWAG